MPAARIASADRMATGGALTMGGVNIVPNAPLLAMV
jgi:hypothetical protein